MRPSTTFAVSRSAITVRLDPHYNLPEHVEIERAIRGSPFRVTTLADPAVVAAVIEGRITPPRDAYSDDVDDPLFLRAQNVGDGELDFGDAKRITREAFEAEPKGVLAPGDVALTIDGVLLGKAAHYDAGQPECCISNHLVRIRPGAAVDPAFLADYLNSPFGQRQIQREITGSAIPGIRTDAIRRILIPLPPLDTQRALSRRVAAARAERRGRVAAADRMLEQLGGDTVHALGIAPPKDEARLAFALPLRAARERLDVDFHTPQFRNLSRAIERGRFTSIELGAACENISSGFAAGRAEQATGPEDGLYHIRPLNITSFGELTMANSKFVVAARVSPADILTRDEVLFNNTNSAEWVGKSAVFDLDEKCAASNHITRLRVSAAMLLPAFLAIVLNAYRAQGLFRLLATNFNNQAGVNAQTLRRLRIPLPELPKQRAITESISEQKLGAKHLADRAEEDWRHAKADFARALSGRVGP